MTDGPVRLDRSSPFAKRSPAPAAATRIAAPTGELPSAGRRTEQVLRRNQNFFRTRVGLHVVGQPSYRAWSACGMQLARDRTSIQWALGDWLRYGEGRGDFGEYYAQAADFTQYSEGTLQNFVWVCGRYEISRRNEKLSFSHHSIIAALHPKVQDRLLALAVERGWSSRELDHEADPFRDTPKYKVKTSQPERPDPPAGMTYIPLYIEGTRAEVQPRLNAILAGYDENVIVHVDYYVVGAAESVGEALP